MTPYAEKSTQLLTDAQIAVLVLGNADCTDVEFLPLKPRAANENFCQELRTRWPGRGLRSIGVVGLSGTEPVCAFKEELGPEKVLAVANAFLVYVSVLLGDAFAKQLRPEPAPDDSIEWLTQLYSLPDLRPD